MSYKGHQYIFVMYVYDANAILLRPLKTREGSALLEACISCYNYLQQRKLTPKLHVVDNECSQQLKHFIEQNQQTTIQFTEADNHSINAAERAIQTTKNHLIAGYSTVNKEYPMQLWDENLPQAQDTLNLLRRCQVNPKLLAYAFLNGQYNFNKTPLAPPGTKALTFVDPK